MSDELWDKAIDHAAESYGCTPESECWQRCIDDAYDHLRGME